MTQKRWQEFVEELLDSFPHFKVSWQELAG
jgi:hypothetical protein